MHVGVTVQDKLRIERRAAEEKIACSALMYRYIMEGLERDQRSVH